MPVIDPYSLLGVNIHSELSELKQNYHSLALICHPDKGGDKNDMIMIHKAYKYIKEQLEYASNEAVVNVDYDFNDFLKNNKDILPTYNEIWKDGEASNFLEEFNRNFEDQYQLSNSIPNFSGGYGEFMEKDIINYDTEVYEILKLKFTNSNGIRPVINHIFSYLTQVHHKFENKLIIYEEPTALPDNYGFNERLDLTKTDDFSANSNNLDMTDYRLAHSGPTPQHQQNHKTYTTLEDLIAEREALDKSLS